MVLDTVGTSNCYALCTAQAIFVLQGSSCIVQCVRSPERCQGLFVDAGQIPATRIAQWLCSVLGPKVAEYLTNVFVVLRCATLPGVAKH